MKWKLRCIIGLMTVAALVVPVAADDEGEAKQPASGEQAAEVAEAKAAETASAPEMPAGAQGIRVYRDPATGRFRAPNAAERAELARAVAKLANRSAEGLTQQVRPDGSAVVHLQGRFRNIAVATIATDGTLDYDCVTSEESLEQLEEELAEEESEKEQGDE